MENCIKKFGEYLRELCLNNHIRYKPQMNNLIEDLKMVKDVIKEVEADEKALLSIENLSSSENQFTKIFKESLLSSQSYVKELLADLDSIELTDELHKIQTKLQGNVWGAKLVAMKEELLRVR